MAGKARSLPRKDLEFMANDIGPEIVDLMEPQDLIKNMSPKKRKRLISLFSPEARLASLSPEERLANLNPEEFLKGISPETQKALFGLIAKTLPGTRTRRNASQWRYPARTIARQRW